MTKSLYRVIGVMSGTSLDGIDLIYVKFNRKSQWNFEIIFGETIPYSIEWKETLRTLIDFSKEELLNVDISYTQYLGDVIIKFIQKNSIKEIDFISSHGHTALHDPSAGLTYQIGNIQLLSDVIREKVICDFRVRDVELGGQGAPLVPIGDKLLFGAYDICLNLGGFANMSFEQNGKRIAYDICPVNTVLNYYVSSIGLEFDENGDLAAQGNVHSRLLNELNNLPFYKMLYPKSLGLEWVKEIVIPIINQYEIILEDVLCTFVEHISIQISSAIFNKGENVFVSGGGAYNTYLISRIKFYTSAKIIIPPHDIIEFKEALIFSLLGVLRDRNEVNCLASVTGAYKDHSSGKVFLPKP